MRTRRTVDERNNWKSSQKKDIEKNHQEIKDLLRWFQSRRINRKRRQHDRRNQARRLWEELDATESITSDFINTTEDKKMIDCSIYTAFWLYSFVFCLSYHVLWFFLHHMSSSSRWNAISHLLIFMLVVVLTFDLESIKMFDFKDLHDFIILKKIV